MRMGLPVDAADVARTGGMCSGRGALAALSGALAMRPGSSSFWLTVSCSLWGRCRLHATRRITGTTFEAQHPSEGEVCAKWRARGTLYMQKALSPCISCESPCALSSLWGVCMLHTRHDALSSLLQRSAALKICVLVPHAKEPGSWLA